LLQCPLLEDEVSSCVKHCSFNSMKNNKMINYSLIPDEIMDYSKGSFMRKGGFFSVHLPLYTKAGFRSSCGVQRFL